MNPVTPAIRAQTPVFPSFPPNPLLVRAKNWLRKLTRKTPAVGHVNFGSLRRLSPISRVFGYDRGKPLDRYYIENFLGEHATDVRGRVLEIAGREYTRQFGSDRVTTSDVLHAVPGNPQATFIGDLAHDNKLPSQAFDCIILTQTLLCIYDLHAVIQTLFRILKPGGVVLATVPGICQIAQPDMVLWGDYWRFTSLSAHRLFADAFGADRVNVTTFGNVLVAASFLHGLAVADLTPGELDHCDPNYPVSICIRAQS